MPTFATPTPLKQQITLALCQLRRAREDGELSKIHYAERNLDRKLVQHGYTRTLAEIDPELDAHLRVSRKGRL